MDYDVYYVDGRNAVSDHRWRGPRPTTIVNTAPPAGTMPTAPVPLAPNTGVYGPGGVYQYPPIPTGYPTTNLWGYPTSPPYVFPPMIPPNNLASILGGFGDVGNLANILAQVVAAFLPLPAAPTPQDPSSDQDNVGVAAATNSSNLIRYQNALALFARRDQQILTLGSVLRELFKRPGAVG